MACRYPGYYLPLYYNPYRSQSKKLARLGINTCKDVKGRDYLVAFTPEKVDALKAADTEHLGSEISCGRCFGCRLNKRKEWTYRLVNESEMYSPDSVWFLTLTYDDSHLKRGFWADVDPRTGELLCFERPALCYDDFTAFRMRLSQRYKYDHGNDPDFSPIRQYHCGEYGDCTLRPHFHMILFGADLKDLALDAKRVPGNHHGMMTSEDLSSLWGQGFAVLQPACYEAMEYVAGYVMKKTIGIEKTTNVELFYEAFDLPKVYESFRGKDRLVHPAEMIPFEKAAGSNRPGIGRTWYEAHKDEVYSTDEMTIIRKGKPIHVKPVSYYDHLFVQEDPWKMDYIKCIRRQRAEDGKLAKAYETHLTEAQLLNLQLELDELNAKKIRRDVI